MRTSLGPAIVALAALLLTPLAPGAARADVPLYKAADTDGEGSAALSAYGWVQPRFTYQQQDKRAAVNFTPNPAFTVQHARVGLYGQVASWARLVVEFELAGSQSTPLIDAFGVATAAPELSVTAGQFRVPFSRQNLLPGKALQFADTAFFVTPKFVVDRDMGVMVSGDLFAGRARYFAGMYDGNEPGRGQTQNSDAFFLFAGRVELSPLGPPPRFEGDLRPVAERGDFAFVLGGGAMRNRLEEKHFIRTYLGADLGIWFRGASLYAEYYHRDDRPTPGDAAVAAGVTAKVTAEGFNVQVGYFAPLPWVEEHLELAARVHRFDPNKQIKQPNADPGARDLDQSNPLWGYQGYTLGVNVFPRASHELKLQASYELRNETKRCMAGQTGSGCTGYIKNDLFVLQATLAF